MKGYKAKASRIVALLLLITVMLSMVMSCTGTNSEIRNKLYEEFEFTARYKRTYIDNQIAAWRWVSGEFTAKQKQNMNQRVIQKYNVQLVRNATTKYNCHSYAWHSQSSSNIYWVDYPTIYMNRATLLCNVTAGYSTIPNGVAVNDIAVYITGGKPEHSAIVYNLSSNMVASKWGAMGLYRHRITKCPYYVSPLAISYYRK